MHSEEISRSRVGPSSATDVETSRHRLHIALEARRLEIELFWRRSLFFWGFIAAAFIGVAQSYDEHPKIALALTCFGLICSHCWLRANQGSKYWHEAWENKVGREEDAAIGLLFKAIEPQKKKDWFSSRRYSVSKLAIALSAFALLLWFGILVYQVVFSFDWPESLTNPRDVMALSILLPTTVAMILIERKCQTSLPKEGHVWEVREHDDDVG